MDLAVNVFGNRILDIVLGMHFLSSNSIPISNDSDTNHTHSSGDDGRTIDELGT